MSARAQPRYSLKSGSGWAVCEAYVKFLNAMPANEGPPLCDMKFKRVPGMREPDWEELNIAAHLPVVHQIELLLGIGHFTPAPDQDFDRWKEQGVGIQFPETRDYVDNVEKVKRIYAERYAKELRLR